MISRLAVLLVVVPALLRGHPLKMRQVAEMPFGAMYGRILCGDTDRDGYPEMVVARYALSPARRYWEVLEYRPVNRFQSVYSDTGSLFPYPPGIEPGDFTPWDIGDSDGDSLVELLGYHIEGTGSSWRFVIGIQESPSLRSHPESLVWWDTLYPEPTASYPPCYYAGDLDDDQRQEVFCHDLYQGYVCVFENTGNNQNRLVFRKALSAGYDFAFGDFDRDVRKEFATAGISSLGMLWVYENTGDDSFALVWDDTMRIPNGGDAFAGDDVDRDGKPEFFMRYAWFPGSVADFHLFMFEASSNNTYERTLVDRFTRQVGWTYEARSMCGDVDGDSADEVIWSTGTDVRIYRPTGDNQFDLVWHWLNPTQSGDPKALVDVFDLNGNGYAELVLTGIFGGSPGYPEYGTRLFEVGALEVKRPNGGESLVPGDTCWIRWDTFTPPRCDSVSLFLLTDMVVPEGEWFWHLDTIVTGLSPSDTVYPWVVPDTALDAAWIVAIAYGPGWQFDRSDNPFSIIPSGVAERRKKVAPGPMPVPTIVGGVLWLGPDLGHDPKSQSGFRSCPASLLDITGRKVMDLRPGENDIRHVAPGVYFVVTPSPLPSGAAPGFAKPPEGERRKERGLRSAESGGRAAVVKVVIQR